MKTIRTGENERFEISKKTVKGVLLAFYAEAALVNVGINWGDLDLSKINVKLNLIRGGRTYTLFSDMLQVLALESAWFHERYTNYHAGGAADTFIEMVASGVAAKEIGIGPVYIDFGGIIQLSGDDRLAFEMQLPSGAWSADINTSNSYCLVDYDETIGVERYTPYIDTVSIKANETTSTLGVSDDVMSVTFLNLDKTDVLEANKVIDSCTISGDYYHNSDTYYQLHAKRLISLPIPGMSADRYQSFRLLDQVDLSGQLLDNGKIDLQLTGTNVAGGKNYIVVRKMYTDIRMLTQADSTLGIHAYRREVRYGAEPNAQRIERLQTMKDVSRIKNSNKVAGILDRVRQVAKQRN